MYVIESTKSNSTWLIVGGILLLLLIIFLVWVFWYYWGSSSINVSQESFTVYSGKSAHIKPCNGYVSRLAFCAKEAATVTVTIHLHNQSQSVSKTIALPADSVYWWEFVPADVFPNFSSVTVSADKCVDVIAEVVTTNLCECKKKCESSCGTSKCGSKC